MPIGLIMGREEALKMIQANDVKLKFKKIKIDKEDGYHPVGYLIPVAVELIFPSSHAIYEYPQAKFLYLSTVNSYRKYIRKPYSRITE